MPSDVVTISIKELIETLKELQLKGCNQVGVEGTLYVVDEGCHSVIASTEPQW